MQYGVSSKKEGMGSREDGKPLLLTAYCVMRT